MRFEKINNFRGILLTALLVRCIAAIFSQGYGMHDDHFLIIEAAASWVEGYDYNHWLPWSPGNTGHPEGHSFTYVGLNFLFFWVLKGLGILDPKSAMLINRFLHALFSMLVVHYGMKITEKLSARKSALRVGWLLALLWIIPFVSVRNLVEMSAAPLLVYGTWLIIKKESFWQYFLAGIVMGLSVSFRYQIGVFVISVGIYLLLRQNWHLFGAFVFGNVLIFCLTQGLVDYFIWGYPFAEMYGYVTYNLKEGTQYLPNSNYLMYLWVLMGCFFLPLGLLMGYGFFRSAKKYSILFIPTFAFLLFHTIYPNRQERFILSILPFFIILGVLGYDLLKDSSRKQKIWKYSMIIFWVFNIPFLISALTMYSKRSRVEAMYSIYGEGDHIDMILMEGSGSGSVSMMPKFYGKCWKMSEVSRTDSLMDLRVNPAYNYPYIFFFDEKDLSQRIDQYRKIYPKMSCHFKSYPSWIDELLRKLNPRNANEYIEVWKTNYSPNNQVHR